MVGRTGWDLGVYASSFALDLGMAVALVPSLGPKGAAIAQASTLVFSNALRLFLVWRFVGIQPYDRNYARIVGPAALGAFAMLGVHAALEGPKWALDLVVTGLVGGLVYYTAFLLVGLTPGEKGAVMRVLGRGTKEA
jgi:O-antigen/teichoic acid export membrane protein